MPWAQGACERGGQRGWLHRHKAQRISGDKPNTRNQILVGTDGHLWGWDTEREAEAGWVGEVAGKRG